MIANTIMGAIVLAIITAYCDGLVRSALKDRED